MYISLNDTATNFDNHTMYSSSDTVQKVLTIDDVCKILSISKATAKNWIRLGKMIPDIYNQLFSAEYIERFVLELKSNDNTKLKSRRNKKLQPALEKEIIFIKGEDSLGFIYISLRDIGQRKCSGAYYTPEKVVNELIDKLYENDANLKSKTICDPCCGTGNFLLRLSAKGIDCSKLYGQDKCLSFSN